jgi:hypothetical protein
VAVLALALAALSAGTVRAGITLGPISTSGYNWDAVVENNTTAFRPNTAQYLDNPKFALFETGYRNDQYGLPTSGAISASTGSETLNFQLMPYGSGTGLSNNALYLNIGTTLTLATPGHFSQLAALDFSTEADPSNGVGNVILHFSNGTSSTYSGAFYAPDWFKGGSNIANTVRSRVNLTTGGLEDTGNAPYLYYSLISLTAADMAKTLTSVRFTRPPNAGYSFVMGLSGAAVPEPSSVVPMAIACVLILAYSGRRLLVPQKTRNSV